MSFEERLSGLLDRRHNRQVQADRAAAGQDMPAVANRYSNFLAFPPGTDPSVNYTNAIQRGVYRIPQVAKAVFNNNSPLPNVSAKPQPGGGVGTTSTPFSKGPGVRVTQQFGPTRAVARGATGDMSRGDRVKLVVEQTRGRIRGILQGS